MHMDTSLKIVAATCLKLNFAKAWMAIVNVSLKGSVVYV